VLHLLAQGPAPNKFADFIDKVARTPLSQVVYFVLACTLIRVFIYPYLVKTKPHNRTGAYTFARFMNESLDAVIYAGVFVFLLIRPFCIQAFKIPSGSMLETLQINDYIVANKAIYRYTDPQFGDIVVFKPPMRALREDQYGTDVDFIKRCIGLPGDTIEIKAGVLYRNGQAVNEKWVHYLVPLDHQGMKNRKASPEEKEMQLRDFKLVFYQDKYWPLTINGSQVNGEWGRSAPEFMPENQQVNDELLALPPAKIPPKHYLMIGDNRFNSFDGRGWGLVPREDIIGRSEFVWFPPGRWGSTD